jgi:hypothetical protein
MQKISNLTLYTNTEIGIARGVEEADATLKAILDELKAAVDLTKGLSIRKSED